MRPLSIRRIGSIAILRPGGPLVGDQVAEELQNRIQELQNEGNRYLIVNLEAVEFINSACLGVLVAVCAEYRRRGASVGVCHPTKKVRAQKDSGCSCWRSMQWYDSEDEAIASMTAARGDSAPG
jgi:anti-anti-sigma factor